MTIDAVLLKIGGALLFGLGVAWGLLLIGIGVVLKQAVYEPVWEWILEAYERAYLSRPNEDRQSKKAGEAELVIVSDLHIDTWDRAPEGRKLREEAFVQFLKAVEESAMELYVNGDLFDAPPNPQDVWQGDGFALRGSILPKYESILAAIASLNNKPPLPVTVSLLFGNHDMAASGLQYDLVKRTDLLKIFSVPFNKSWYPNVVIGVPRTLVAEGQEEYRFYIDHGHFYDPALLLYLKDFLFAALRSDLRKAMTTLVLSGQRRATQQESIPTPGLSPPKPLTFDQRAVKWLVKYRWRWKARVVLAQRNLEEVRQGSKPLTGALFGHTHLPDSYVYRKGRVRGMMYVNTGDWMGDTGHGTYTLITQDGVVSQYDWLDGAKRAPHHQGVKT